MKKALLVLGTLGLLAACSGEKSVDDYVNDPQALAKKMVECTTENIDPTSWTGECKNARDASVKVTEKAAGDAMNSVNELLGN